MSRVATSAARFKTFLRRTTSSQALEVGSNVAVLTLNRADSPVRADGRAAWSRCATSSSRRCRARAFVRQQLAHELNVALAVARVIGPIQEDAQPGKTFNNAPKRLVQRGVVQITWLWRLHTDRIQLLEKVRCRNPSRSRRQLPELFLGVGRESRRTHRRPCDGRQRSTA
jgi:hypothetical protein